MRKRIWIGIGTWMGMMLLLVLVANPMLAQDDGNNATQKQAKVDPGAAIGPTAKPATADPNYVIGPDDMLDISVWKESDLSRAVPVRPDGKISLPLLNDVQAAGLTPNKLGEQIAASLNKYVTNPQVTVIVTQINSQRFYITGEVSRAGAYSLVPGMTVLQGLSNAGGFTQYANRKKIFVRRIQGNTVIKFPFNYNDVLAGKQLSQDIVLKAGDTIVVP